MANYPTVPVLLSTIDPTLPTGQEDASKIDDVLRQTRSIFRALLENIMSDAGVLIPPTVLGAESVTSNSIGDNQILTRHLNNLTVSREKISDGAIDQSKMADLSIGSNQLINDSILNEHILDGEITAAKFAALTITGDKISSSASDDTVRAIGPDHLKNGAVIERAILDQAVSAAKMKSGGATTLGRFFFDSSSVVSLLEVSPDSQVLPSVVAGQLMMQLNAVSPYAANVAIIKEIGGDGGLVDTVADAGVFGTGWVNRPFKVSTGINDPGDTSLVEVYDPNSLVSFITDSSSGFAVTKIKFAKAGKYIGYLWTTAYESTSAEFCTHASRLINTTVGTLVLLETSHTSLKGQAICHGYAVFDVLSNDVCQIQSYARVTSHLSVQLGHKAGFLSTETLACLVLQKVS